MKPNWSWQSPSHDGPVDPEVPGSEVLKPVVLAPDEPDSDDPEEPGPDVPDPDVPDPAVLDVPDVVGPSVAIAVASVVALPLVSEAVSPDPGLHAKSNDE